jgi:hypothetical protein
LTNCLSLANMYHKRGRRPCFISSSALINCRLWHICPQRGAELG